MKLPPMWKPDKCLMNHNTWVLFEGYKRLTSKGDSQCDPDLSNLEGCFFLPSSWYQRSPSEKVETFLHIFSDIGEQLLSAESEMGIGILSCSRAAELTQAPVHRAADTSQWKIPLIPCVTTDVTMILL